MVDDEACDDDDEGRKEDDGTWWSNESRRGDVMMEDVAWYDSRHGLVGWSAWFGRMRGPAWSRVRRSVGICKALKEAMKQYKCNDVLKSVKDVGRKGVEPMQNNEPK